MKTSKKKLLTIVVLLAAAICISAYARRAGTPLVQDTHMTLKFDEKATPVSFDAQITAGKIVGMTALYPGGDRVALKQQSKPTCATSCPAGQYLSCWEDHEQQMSICVCKSSGGGGSSAVVSLGKLGRVE
jgi:hypothetical protein